MNGLAFLSLPIGRLRCLGYIEGVSLIVLVALAITSRVIGEEVEIIGILGPVHGITFILYFAQAINVASSGGLSRAAMLRVSVASIIPFGTFFNDRYLSELDSRRVDEVFDK